jgi:hypothetical protein
VAYSGRIPAREAAGIIGVAFDAGAQVRFILQIASEAAKFDGLLHLNLVSTYKLYRRK